MAEPISVMAILGPMMLLAMIVSPGVQCQIELNDINKAIDQAKIDKDDLQKQWQSVFNEEAAVSKQIQDDIVEKFDKINQSIAKANISHRQFKESNKTIQYMGIIFICFIFTLLLLKQFDLFDFNLFGKNK